MRTMVRAIAAGIIRPPRHELDPVVALALY
jgi:hypothetical protein